MCYLLRIPSTPTLRTSDLHRLAHRSGDFLNKTQTAGHREAAQRMAPQMRQSGAQFRLKDHRQQNDGAGPKVLEDRKSTRLNSSHLGISYAVFCLKKKSQ